MYRNLADNEGEHMGAIYATAYDLTRTAPLLVWYANEKALRRPGKIRPSRGQLEGPAGNRPGGVSYDLSFGPASMCEAGGRMCDERNTRYLLAMKLNAVAAAMPNKAAICLFSGKALRMSTMVTR